MGFFDPLKEFSPSKLKGLANERLSDLVEREGLRARDRLDELKQRYPAAGERELSQRFVDTKKNLASVVGGVTGVFGVATVPLDLVGMAYLQLSLLTEVATVYKANLRTEVARNELIDLFGYANGIGPLQRASPRVLGSVAKVVFTRTGLGAIGRAMPLVAAPISAYLNGQHVQRVGDAAVRHYDGWVHANQKHRKASGS